MVSVEVAGPQESSEGSAEIISDSEIGAMIAMGFDVGIREGEVEIVNISMCGRKLSGAGNPCEFSLGI